MSMSEAAKHHKENPLINIGLNVIIPSVIMTKFSNADYLGPVWGLVVALAFPISYGLWDFLSKGKTNFFSLLGLFSVLMTGGIGLLKLDKNWMVVKETAIPALMGIGVLVSAVMGKPLVRLFLDQIMDIPKIDEAFKNKGHDQLFEKNIKLSNTLLAGTFFLSAVLNFVLAVWILEGETGSEKFNESLGKMTLLSFPVITVPMMVMVMGIIFFLINSIKRNTDLELEEVIKAE
ncbi:MAG: MFS transporter [Deltaproteobacteria bacterium]|nr:MAG: MFS transporter [Deltaproteobacteria bacterium]TNF26685.1 MAG: MFS transporter [Deltaproteobacteria bacterium]